MAGEVIFDRNHPFDPPDLIFSTEDNRREFCPDLEKLQVKHTFIYLYVVPFYQVITVSLPLSLPPPVPDLLEQQQPRRQWWWWWWWGGLSVCPAGGAASGVPAAPHQPPLTIPAAEL